MDFPLMDLLDEQACYDFLVDALHPDGLRCPSCGGQHLTIHRAHRDPVLDYRCACGRVFNAWTGTALQGTQHSPAELILIVRGIAQGVPTARLARELGCSRSQLLQLRHRLQHRAWVGFPRRLLPDAEAAADELFQNAGEKRHSAPRPRRPAAPACQPETRARDGRGRPSAGGRRGRSRQRPGAVLGSGKCRSRSAPMVRGPHDRARRAAVHG